MKIITSLILIFLLWCTPVFADYSTDNVSNILYTIEIILGIISMIFFAALPFFWWYRIEQKYFIPGTRAYNAAQLANIIFFIINIILLFKNSKKN